MHRYGAFNIHLDLLANKHGFAHVNNGDIQSKVDVSYDDTGLTMRCLIDSLRDHRRYCGATIKLNDDPSKGLDFSRYKNIIIDMAYQSPSKEAPVRLLLRNYDPAYANIYNSASLKYNTVQFIPSKELLSKPIPIQSLQVASWWITEYKISYDNAQLDISNVSLVEIETSEASLPGEYVIHVKKLILQGSLFSESMLFKGLLTMWLLACLFMVGRQHKALTLLLNQDTLTQLVNRRGLSRWLDKRFTPGESAEDIVLFYIDIDDFKTINDSYGHLVGDNLLREFSSAIINELEYFDIENISNGHTLARLSGDEFALIIDGLNDLSLHNIANRLISRFGHTLTVDSMEIMVNASIGIARGTRSMQSSNTLMGHADAAMYYSKKSGKNQYKIFDDKIHEGILFKKRIASALRVAIEKELFSLVFMPIYSSKNHSRKGLTIAGAEVLLRCTSEELSGIGSEVFVPIAEEYGLIREIDLWVIEATFALIAKQHELLAAHRLKFSINISALELTNKCFPTQVESLLTHHQIPPELVELELTETSLIDVDESSIALLHKIKELGITLSLDDFGTGYTAFNQLNHYPVNCLKIDRAFVSKITPEYDSTLMVDVILAIAESYELNVIAEGVESEYQKDYLIQKGCHFLQGYHLCKPVAWPEFKKILTNQKSCSGSVHKLNKVSH